MARGLFSFLLQRSEEDMAKEWAERIYKGGRWRATRESYLEHSGGCCERCSTDDDPVVAVIVHHKTYLTPENIHDADIVYGFDNLEGLCMDCHNKEHKKKEEERARGACVFDANGNPLPR